MAPPLVAAVPILGSKILGLAKGIIGGGKAAAGVKAAVGVGPQLTGATKGAFMRRAAGDALGKAGTYIGSHTPKSLTDAANLIVGKDLMSKPADLAFRLAPDAAFGLMGAAMTPGDLGDKAIAGTTQFLGGGLTGLAMGRGARAMGASQRVADMVDMGGSIAGDMIGMQVGDGLMRIKGGGMTPWEKQAAEQDELYRAQVMQELQQQFGLV